MAQYQPNNDENSDNGLTVNNWIALGGLIIAAITCYFSFCGKEKPPPQIQVELKPVIKQEVRVEAPQTNNNSANNEYSTNPERREFAPTGQGKYPDASKRYLSASEVSDLSDWELKLMRNEIFARRGYLFHKNPEIIEYFKNQAWYQSIPNKSDDQNYIFNSVMNDIERANINLIKRYEN